MIKIVLILIAVVFISFNIRELTSKESDPKKIAAYGTIAICCVGVYSWL